MAAGSRSTEATSHRRARALAPVLVAAAAVPPVALAALPGLSPAPGTLRGTIVAIALLVVTPALVAFTVAMRGIGAVVERLQAQSNDEHRQIIVRVLLYAAMLLYAFGLALAFPGDGPAGSCLLIAALGLAAAWLFLLHLLLNPAGSAVRRYAAMTVDVAVLTAFLQTGGGMCAAWYPVYPYIAISSGYHFGRRALIVSALLGAGGFAAVALTTPFWRMQPALSAGMVAALVLLPIYVGSVIERLARAQRAAAAASAAKGAFLTTLAEDLQIPLRTIARAGSELDRDTLDPAAWDLIARLRLSARGMLQQLDDALNYARIDDGSFTPETRSFDLYRLVNGAVAAMRLQAAERGIVLGLRIDPRLPYQLRGWPHQFRQILIGLITTTLSRTTRGKVRINLEAIELAGDSAALRLTVAGGVIDEPMPTTAPAPADAGNPPETGRRFGLAMVDRLARLMGGRVSIAGDPHSDLSFAVELSLEIDHALSEMPLDLAGQLVLIVSRDAQFVGELIEPLETWRADARWIGAGDAALAYLAALEPGSRRPLLIVDGRGDVLLALSWAHSAGMAPAAPHLLFVADEARLDSVVGLADGELDGILPAPFSPGELQGALHALCVEPADWFLADPMPAALETPLPPTAATPAPAHEPAPPEPQPPPQREPAPPPAGKLRILVAAPNAANRKIINYVLRRAGHAVALVETVEAARPRLDAREFDLLLLDLTTAAAGYELGRQCRRAWPSLRIIALSGDSAAEAEARGREASLDAVLPKPLEPGRLLRAISAPGSAPAAAPPLRPASVVTEIASHPRFTADPPAGAPSRPRDIRGNPPPVQ